MKNEENKVYELLSKKQVSDFFAKGSVSIKANGTLMFINKNGLLSMPNVSVGDVVNKDFTIEKKDSETISIKKKKKK